MRSEVQPGYYSDGASAIRHNVRVIFKNEMIEIQTESGRHIDVWFYRDLELVSNSRQGGLVTMKTLATEGARLTLTGDNIAETLQYFAPAVLKKEPGRSIRKPLVITAVTVAIMGLLILVYPVLTRFAANLVPTSWEREYGRDTVAFWEQHWPVCTNKKGIAALEKMSDRLVAQEQFPYRPNIQVLNFGMVNAFAAPGGEVVLFRGLIEKAGSAEEVAGILAHELGHVTHRHPIKGAIDAIGLSIFLQSFGGDVGGFAAQITALSNSRKNESEADETAIRILKSAHISPSGLKDFFDSISKDADSTISGFPTLLSSHPKTEDRAEMVRRSLEQSAITTAILTEAEWQDLKAICPQSDQDEVTESEENPIE